MTVKHKILTLIKPVIEQSRFVNYNKEKINSLALQLRHERLPDWDQELQFLGTPEETAQYYFFLDSLNFCFWAPKGQKRWRFQKDGQWIKGYYAFSYAIKKAVENNPKLLDAVYLTNITFDEFRSIFSGKNELLLLKERYQIIQENFAILQDRFNGHAKNLIVTANHDVNKLVELILDNFPSFRDMAEIDGQKVYLLKRAQIFPSDISFALSNEGLGNFDNLDDLTMFADYKLPQLLQAHGVLEYSKELFRRIKNENLIEPGSREEVEIRANTIWTFELLRNELARLGRLITNSDLDWMLWVKSKETIFELPYHKTITIYY